ncbi:hypothetical protein [Auraticoccus monumenti]|uniref:WD40-like Beta Propeller Repeat n=1 Tax=Auraticoccus monumenti TaxID=675864 RepID=A0A1G7E4Y5_9ACTN|nr:hypothetical protein [Auraticoccus monumenti]SDE58712.1 hypothetical protein SAMN04489747_3823 [Auraticoccus monumenti]
MPAGREDADGDGVDHLDQGPPSPSDARRLVLLTVLLLVGALVAVVGLSRPDASVTPEPSPTAPVERPTPSTRPTPSPSPSATADEDQPVRDTSGVPVLPDADPSWELFLQTARDVQRLQLSTGDVVRTRSRVASAPGSRAAFLPGPDGVLAFSEESGTAEYVPDDAAAERVEIPGALERSRGFLSLLPGPPGHAWVSRFDYEGGATAVELVDLTGRPAGGESTITVPGTAWPAVLPDGVGGLLVQATGGVWSLAGPRPQRITRGRVLATGPRVLVVLDCDDALICSRYVLEPGTGRERRVGMAQPSDGYAESGLTSPDGRWMAVRERGGDGTDRVVVTDLLDGRTVASLPDGGGSLSVDPANAMAWTPDSGQLFHLDGDGLGLFDPATSERRRVELGGVTPVRLALRAQDAP